MRAHAENDQSLAAAKTTDQITDSSGAFWPPPPKGVANSELVSGVPPGALEPPQRPVRVRPGVYVCGDHRDHASIHGAMVSGRRAAEAVLSDLSR